MDIREGRYQIQNNSKKAIIEFVFENYIIYVFQGELSDFDIIIKYKKDGTRIRTPKHIHWVVDVLMKMQAEEEITRKFLLTIQKCWEKCRPLDDNSYATLKKLIEDGEKEIKIDEYKILNIYGEYDVEFLYVLMELLAVQEKTNRADAYMFGNIIKELLETDRDIFKIISTAGFGGRR
jgi:hypothetical protein